MNRRKFLNIVGCCSCSYIINSCASVPITDRKQLNLIPTQFPQFISARAITAPGSIYAHTLLVQIGKKYYIYLHENYYNYHLDRGSYIVRYEIDGSYI